MSTSSPPDASASRPSDGESPHEARRFNAFTRRLILVLIVLFGVGFVWQAPSIPLLIFGAVLLACLLDGLASLYRRIPKIGLTRGPSVVIAVVTCFGAVVGLIAYLGPSIAEQTEQILESLPDAVERLEEEMSGFALGRAVMNQTPSKAELEDAIDDATGKKEADASAIPPALRAEPPGDPRAAPRPRRHALDPDLSGSVVGAAAEGDDALSKMGSFFTSTFGLLADLAILLVLALYFVATPDKYKALALRVFPQAQRDEADATFQKIAHLLKRWLAGRLLSMLVVTILTGIGLALIGLPYYVTLALVAGLLSFIPNLGPILGAAPGVLVGLLESPTMAAGALAVYAVTQILESYLVTPKIQERAVQIPPALLLTSQLMFGVIFGGLGLLLATPLLVVTIVGLQKVYVEGFLGDTGTPLLEGAADDTTKASSGS